MSKAQRKRPIEAIDPAERELVKAWLYMAVGPMLTGLGHERVFLGKQQNPTWRFYSQHCEYVRPVREYVDAGQHRTLDMFFREHAPEHRLAKSHDGALESLESAATSAHAALVRLPELTALKERIETEFPNWRGAFQPKDAAALLAENVVNLKEVSDLPSHYTNAAAWKRYGREALGLRANRVVAPAFDRLEKALAAMNGSSAALEAALDKLSSDLAHKYRVPPVPADSGVDEPDESSGIF